MDAIWYTSDLPNQDRDFALFRKVVSLPDTLRSVQLHVFADTHYKVWFDGQYLGCGPARFSVDIQEYDRYSFSQIDKGQHVIAVLVEWAPVQRREESVRPALYAQLVSDQGMTLASSDPTWKVMRSNAWSYNSALVHAWDLIGPTEVLDYHLLPVGWQTLAFNDQAWGQATVVDRNQGQGGLRPPSIAQMQSSTRQAQVISTGLLSPNAHFGELLPGDSTPYVINLQSPSPDKLTVEMISVNGAPAADLFAFSAGSVSWSAAGGNRVDVYQAVLHVPAGSSTLTVQYLPQDGLTFSLSASIATFSSLPMNPGYHPGRRLLLAQYLKSQNDVAVAQNADGTFDVDFPSGQSYVVFDAGRIFYGRLEAQVSGSDGTEMMIGWDTRLYQDGRVLSYPGSLHNGLWDQTDAWILDGTHRNLTTVDTRTGRYIVVSAWGNVPVHLSHLRLVEMHYPVVQTGTFSTDNDRLNRVWQIGVDTLLTNMLDGYVEPWRERAQWWGDTYVSDQVNWSVYGDTALMKRALVQIDALVKVQGHPSSMVPSAGDDHMLDYMMLWVHSLQEYIERTDDINWLTQTYPQVVTFMNFLTTYKSTYGLLETPSKAPWSETGYIDTYAWQGDRWGLSTAINSMYYETLLRAAYLANRDGKAADASSFHSQAQQVRDAINANLYDASAHRYYASIYPDHTKAAPTVYAQSWALTYGVVPGEEVDAVVQSMLELIPPNVPGNEQIGTYAMYWVLSALGSSGHIAEGLDIIETFYGSMMDRGATTWWENFDADSVYSNSLDHSWSASPTWFLTTYALGAQTKDGQFWEVAPDFADLKQVQGSIPLEHGGVLIVSWRMLDDADAEIDLNATEGTWGILKLPADHPNMTISVDGNLVWSNASPLAGAKVVDGTIQVSIAAAGEHIVQISGM
jgi:alpha-L-rhamnosidase